MRVKKKIKGGRGLLKKCFSGLMPSFPRRRESRFFIVLLDARSPLNACGDKFIGHDKLFTIRDFFNSPAGLFSLKHRPNGDKQGGRLS